MHTPHWIGIAICSLVVGAYGLHLIAVTHEANIGVKDWRALWLSEACQKPTKVYAIHGLCLEASEYAEMNPYLAKYVYIGKHIIYDDIWYYLKKSWDFISTVVMMQNLFGQQVPIVPFLFALFCGWTRMNRVQQPISTSGVKEHV